MGFCGICYVPVSILSVTVMIMLELMIYKAVCLFELVAHAKVFAHCFQNNSLLWFTDGSREDGRVGVGSEVQILASLSPLVRILQSFSLRFIPLSSV